MARELGKIHLETLLAHTGLAVAAIDAEGRMSLFSPALEELFGSPFQPISEDDMVAEYSLFAADGTTPLRTEDIPLARARRGETVTNAVVTTRRSNGQLVYLRCNAAPLRGEGGELLGGVVFVQDVTAEHAARRQQEVLRERLVMTINHELRTPLTKLLGHTELMQGRRREIPRDLLPSLTVLSRAVQDLHQIVEVISDLADLESHARLDKTSSCLSALLRDCLESARVPARARNIEIACRVPEPLVATVDPGALQRAVCALLDNAVAYAPTGSDVDLDVSADRDWVRIDVCDRGVGIAVADRPRLVEPFERGAHPRQPVNSRGLGLTLAHTVAKAHGGELLLRDHESGGLRASLVLPRHGAVARPIRTHADDDASAFAGRQGV